MKKINVKGVDVGIRWVVLGVASIGMWLVLLVMPLYLREWIGSAMGLGCTYKDEGDGVM